MVRLDIKFQSVDRLIPNRTHAGTELRFHVSQWSCDWRESGGNQPRTGPEMGLDRCIRSASLETPAEKNKQVGAAEDKMMKDNYSRQNQRSIHQRDE